jgi:hypothetical protein
MSAPDNCLHCHAGRPSNVQKKTQRGSNGTSGAGLETFDLPDSHGEGNTPTLTQWPRLWCVGTCCAVCSAVGDHAPQNPGVPICLEHVPPLKSRDLNQIDLISNLESSPENTWRVRRFTEHLAPSTQFNLELYSVLPPWGYEQWVFQNTKSIQL